MAGPRWKNIYNLSDEQVEKIDSAERLMEMMQINEAEEMLKEMLGESPDCVPVLNILGTFMEGIFPILNRQLSITKGPSPSSQTMPGPETKEGDTSDISPMIRTR